MVVVGLRRGRGRASPVPVEGELLLVMVRGGVGLLLLRRGPLLDDVAHQRRVLRFLHGGVGPRVARALAQRDQVLVDLVPACMTRDQSQQQADRSGMPRGVSHLTDSGWGW